MNYATNLCIALEKIIEELKKAGVRAKKNGDRVAERNLAELQVSYFEIMLKNTQAHIPYIIQKKYAKYFENNP